ncbi:MAG: DUF1559 domain-containing protein [Planctomyces sp.]|nr:DUF1559 domain-containing protein [Planctomyces sp.]
MNAMGNLLVCGVLQVTLVAAVGLIATAVCSRWGRNAAVSPAVWALMSIIVLTVLTFVSMPSWLTRSDNLSTVTEISVPLSSGDGDETILAQEASLGVASDVPAAEPQTWAGFSELISAGWEGVHNLNAPQSESLQESTANAGGLVSWQNPWPYRFFIVFAAGIVLGVLRMAGGLISVRLLVSTSRPLSKGELSGKLNVVRTQLQCPVDIELRESSRLSTAATVGYWRPVILLSSEWKTWPEEQLRSVLAHEVAHIVRGDFGLTLAAQVSLILHFYHPLVHWIVGRLRLEQELAADALAAKVVGGPQQYLRAIGELALAQSKEPVNWPAHAFLPTRRTFLRRIEMLREKKRDVESTPLLLRFGTVAAVLTAAIVAVGIRPPVLQAGAESFAAETSSTGSSGESKVSEPQSVASADRFIPADAVAVAVVRPSELFPVYQAMIAASGHQPEIQPGSAIAQSEQAAIDLMKLCQKATVVVGPLRHGGQPPVAVVLSFENQESRDSAAERFAPSSEYQKEKFLLVDLEIRASDARYFADERTLILGDTDTVKRMVLVGPDSLSPLTRTVAWKSAANSTAVIAVDPTAIRSFMSELPPNPITGLVSPLWLHASNHTMSITLRDESEIRLVSSSSDEESGEILESSIRAILTMLEGMASNLATAAPPSQKESVEVLGKFLTTRTLSRNDKTVTLVLSGDAKDTRQLIAGVVTPAIEQSRGAAQRSRQSNQLKHIMLAMHNYHAAYNHFPPAVVIDSESGIARSWRVELLPFLEDTQQNGQLYSQYRKNEPWDSEANRAVLAKMPDVYRHPSQSATSTTTSVVAAFGRGLLFDPGVPDGMPISKILDGTSNTIAVFEMKSDIPWTKPEDISIHVQDQDLPEFGGFYPEGWYTGFADGSVRFISTQIDRKVLRNILTRDGGESLNQ